MVSLLLPRSMHALRGLDPFPIHYVGCLPRTAPPRRPVLPSHWPVGEFLWETYPAVGLLDHRPVNFLGSLLLKTQKIESSSQSFVSHFCILSARKVGCLNRPSF